MEREKGFSLLEVMLAIALMGIIAVAFLGALATGSKAIFIADERATAESIARSQMEDIKKQVYDDTLPIEYSLLLGIPANYSITVTAQRLDRDVPPNPTDDDGIQQIIVTVSHNTKQVLTLEDYKVDR